MVTLGFRSLANDKQCVSVSLADAIRHVLNARGYPALRSIDVVVQRDGCVLLGGSVPAYYLKQYAQAAVLPLDGVQSLRNDIEVVSFR